MPWPIKHPGGKIGRARLIESQHSLWWCMVYFSLVQRGHWKPRLLVSGVDWSTHACTHWLIHQSRTDWRTRQEACSRSRPCALYQSMSFIFLPHNGHVRAARLLLPTFLYRVGPAGSDWDLARHRDSSMRSIGAGSPSVWGHSCCRRQYCKCAWMSARGPGQGQRRCSSCNARVTYHSALAPCLLAHMKKVVRLTHMMVYGACACVALGSASLSTRAPARAN